MAFADERQPMGEIKGYTCDGGCGSTTMLERSHENVTRNGWFMTFTPDGCPTLHTCSPPCLVRALEAVGWRGAFGLPTPTNGRPS